MILSSTRFPTPLSPYYLPISPFHPPIRSRMGAVPPYCTARDSITKTHHRNTPARLADPQSRALAYVIPSAHGIPNTRPVPSPPSLVPSPSRILPGKGLVCTTRHGEKPFSAQP